MRKSARTHIPPFFDNDPLIVTCCSIGLHFIIFIVVSENKKCITVFNGFSPNFNSLKINKFPNF